MKKNQFLTVLYGMEKTKQNEMQLHYMYNNRQHISIMFLFLCTTCEKYDLALLKA